ncbi:MAG: dethiobiotin synthase, partial [Rickettsiales bacterium]
MQKFFITATGTEIGKTMITTTLCQQLKMAGKMVAAFKPIISGYDSADMDSDTVLILQSLNLPITIENIEAISPWRFLTPLAPNMAAAREDKYISLDEVVVFCKEQEKTGVDILFVEGVGGVCVPLNNEHTTLDWMAWLSDWKIILVVGSYLGAISHTLTAIKTLEARGLVLHTLIVNESLDSTVE